MKESVISRIMAIKDLPSKDLQKKYEEVFGGKKPTSNNRTYLWRRIAYRMQEIEFGGLPEEAQTKIQELIKEHDPINAVATRPESAANPEANTKKQKPLRDRRLPIPGTIITKNSKGLKIEVKALEKGFEYKNVVYKSLTAIAKEITGAHWNGFLFFNL